MECDEITPHVRLRKLRLLALRECLRSLGFIFEYPNEVLPGPDPSDIEIISRIEGKAGKVPFALKSFYQEIGSVNFNGHHPDWNGCHYPDALNVDSIKVADCELNDFLTDPDRYIKSLGSFRIPIAPDSYHKQNESGGMWYGVPVPCETNDPPLLDEPHSTTFLKYLEIALEWGGCPGLEMETEHTWPLDELRSASKGPLKDAPLPPLFSSCSPE